MTPLPLAGPNWAAPEAVKGGDCCKQSKNVCVKKTLLFSCSVSSVYAFLLVCTWKEMATFLGRGLWVCVGMCMCVPLGVRVCNANVSIFVLLWGLEGARAVFWRKARKGSSYFLQMVPFYLLLLWCLFFIYLFFKDAHTAFQRWYWQLWKKACLYSVCATFHVAPCARAAQHKHGGSIVQSLWTGMKGCSTGHAGQSCIGYVTCIGYAMICPILTCR